ncbi:MAG TPA: hypothetical protein VGB83_07785 [Actinomycetota bacterium]
MREAPGAFHSVRLVVRAWVDHDAMLAGFARFLENPGVTAFVERARAEPPRGVEEEERRVWLQLPDAVREELYEEGGLIETSGRHGGVRWGSGGSRSEVMAHQAGTAIAGIGPRTSSPAPLVLAVLLHPMACELLQPSDLLDMLTFEEVGRGTLLGRGTIEAVARWTDWRTIDPFSYENFPIAEEYRLVVDAERGILLRVSCRTDEVEFATTEVLDVAFDERFDDRIFAPEKDPAR